MKKCPYCAEEIQDEAVFCRYCHRDLKDKSQVISADIVSKPSFDKAKPPRNAFWIALCFGLLGGSATWVVRTQRGIEYPKFGISGYINDLVLGTISSILIWGLIGSLIVWFWRVAIRQTPGIKSFSQASGCVSFLIFLFSIIGFGVFIFLNTDVDRLSSERREIVASNATQEVIHVMQTKPSSLMTAPVPTQTKTLIVQSTAFQDRMEQFDKMGYVPSVYGNYHRVRDFNENFAQMGYYQWYLLPLEPTNFVIRAETSWETASKVSALDSSGCGFAFHVKEKEHYFVFLGMDGYARLSRVQNNETNGTWDNFFQKFEVPSDNAELDLVVYENRIIFLVNGRAVLDVTDNKIPSGSLGITVHSGTNQDFGTRCKMENIEVLELR